MFFASYSNQAEKFLRSSDKTVTKRIMKKIEEIMKDPVIHGSKAVQGL